MKGLIKQLKGEFNDNNLPRFDEITCFVTNNASMGIIFSDDTSLQNVVYADPGSGISFSFTSSVVNASGNGNFYVGNKYKITSISVVNGGFNFDDIKHSPLVNLYLGADYEKSNLSELEQLSVLTNLENLEIHTNIFSGQDISGISELTNITTLKIAKSGIVGSMKQLGKFPNLTDIGPTKATNISGAIEDFVSVRRNLPTPQTTGDVDFYCASNGVTFNDVATIALSHIVWTASGDNTIITWNNSSTTIHVNSDGTWTRIS